MITLKTILLTLFSTFVFSYPGQEEVEALYSQISDIYHPTLEDYQKIEDYLFWDERPYLSFYKDHTPTKKFRTKRVKSPRHLKLIGPNQEMPYRALYHLNTSADDKSRCYCLYASYNKPYPEMVQSHLEQLKKVGFKGHVLFYTGGYPNLERGGLKLSHIYYGWKYAIVEEAYQLGYQQVIWADTAMCPINELNSVFEWMKQTGILLLTYGKTVADHSELGMIKQPVIDSLGISDPSQVILIKGALIGLDFNHQIARDFLKKWGELTQDPINSASFYPDEFILSATASQLHFTDFLYVTKVASSAKGARNTPSKKSSKIPTISYIHMHSITNWNNNL